VRHPGKRGKYEISHESLLIVSAPVLGAEVVSENLSGRVVTVTRAVKLDAEECLSSFNMTDEGRESRSYRCKKLIKNSYEGPYKLTSEESYLNKVALGGLNTQIDVSDPKGGKPAYVDFGADEHSYYIDVTLPKKFGGKFEDVVRTAVNKLPNREIQISILRIQPIQ
jgi:hypothetical protein